MNTTASKSGFTLIELLISMTMLVAVVAGSITVYVFYQRSRVATTLMHNTSSEASMSLERVVYGVGGKSGLRSASATNVFVSFPGGGWRINFDGNRSFRYNPATQRITDEDGIIVSEGIQSSTITPAFDGCEITVAAFDSGGQRSMTNQMTTFVQYRN